MVDTTILGYVPAEGPAGANKSLSNLDDPTAINVPLIPDTAQSLDLGSGAFPWGATYFTGLYPSNNPGLNAVLGIFSTDPDIGGNYTAMMRFNNGNPGNVQIGATNPLVAFIPFITLTPGAAASCVFHEDIQAVTQVFGNDSTKLATTEFVQDAIAGFGPGTVTSVAGTNDRITSSGGATPTIDIAATYVGQTSITTLGTVTTGTWSATNIALNKGGTNAALTASNGGIVYSDATGMAILTATATAGQIPRSGSNAAPSWSTATYPATTTANQLLYSSSANVIAGLTTNNNRVLVTDGSGVPSLGTALPNGITATTQSPGTNNTTVATTAYVDAAAVSGGGILLLASASASASPSLNFASGITSTYDAYELKMCGLVPATDAVTPWVRVSTDGGSSYVSTSSYTWCTVGEGTGTGTSASDTKMVMRSAGGTMGNAAGESMSGQVEFFMPSSSALYKQFKSHITFADTSGNCSVTCVAAMNYKSTTAINAIQILVSSGNITSGAAYLFAYKKV